MHQRSEAVVKKYGYYREQSQTLKILKISYPLKHIFHIYNKTNTTGVDLDYVNYATQRGKKNAKKYYDTQNNMHNPEIKNFSAPWY